MKKLLVLVLVMVLLTPMIKAEIPDISGLKLEELEELRSRIEVELNKRFGENAIPIPKGKYAAGIDIEPGRYEILCAGTATMSHIILSLESAQISPETGERILLDAMIISIGESYFVSMEEGTILTVNQAGGYIRKVPKLFSN